MGRIGDGKKVWERVTVGIVNSLIRNNQYEEELKDIRVVIRDECHGSSSTSHRKLQEQLINVDYSIGLTATYLRKDNSMMVIEGVTGPNIYTVTESAVTNLGIIIKPTLCFIEHSNYSITEPKVFEDKPPVSTVMIEGVSENLSRTKLIVKTVASILNSPRLKGVVLVLVKHIKHGEVLQSLALKEGLDIPFIQGNTKTDLRTEYINKLKDGTLKVAIATSVFNEGEDIPNLEVLVNASGGNNERTYIQQIGRVLRSMEGKTRALVIDIYDKEKYYLATHSKNRIQFARKRYSHESTEVFTNTKDMLTKHF